MVGVFDKVLEGGIDSFLDLLLIVDFYIIENINI